MENKSKALQFLNISHSSFYYKSVKEEKDLKLKSRIEKVLTDNPSYGHRRISIELKINKKKIIRVMKKFGLKPLRAAESQGNQSVMTNSLHLQTCWFLCFLYTKIMSGLPISLT